MGTAMYPNKIIEATHSEFKTKGLYPAHLGIEWLEGYRGNRDKRLELKPQSKQDTVIKMVVDVLKLALNGGGYGKTGDVYNWQYDPLVKYTTTIQCQLDIMMLADMLVHEIPSIKIESGNTDGINVIYDNKYADDITRIYKQWDTITSSQLEVTPYSKVIRTTVNDYMAIKPNGDVKYKGDFEMDKELHKDTSLYIVKKAVDEYYRNGIPVSQTIHACTNIYDFTKSVRVKNTAQGKWKAVYDQLQGNTMNRIEVGKNIRYYVDNTGKGKLRKVCYEGKSNGRVTNIEANNSVILFNQYINKDNFSAYNINYSYYISEAMKIINSVHDGQLSLW